MCVEKKKERGRKGGRKGGDQVTQSDLISLGRFQAGQRRQVHGVQQG